MDWTKVSVRVDGEAAEAVAEALHPFAYGGVSLEQEALDLSPEATCPQLEDHITVSIYLKAEDDTLEKRRRIEEILWHMGQLYPIPAPIFATVREEDWENAWKTHYTPFRIGRRILICPAWETVSHEPDDVLLLMDPGMAFGTGRHPTTRMCLEIVEELARPGISVLDLGTGSGILSIAAARFGAASILALDTDTVAVRSAQENCVRNGVEATVRVEAGSLESLPAGRQWDLLLVNILAPVILQLFEGGMAERIAPGGKIALAGIIEEQADGVLAALTHHRLELVERRQVKDWVSLVARQPG